MKYKPCPFCGSDDLMIFGAKDEQHCVRYDFRHGKTKHDPYLMWVKCRNCYGQISLREEDLHQFTFARPMERLLNERWNRREG